MTPQQLFSHVTQLKMIVGVAILILVIPLRILGPVEIAYLASAYWLVK